MRPVPVAMLAVACAGPISVTEQTRVDTFQQVPTDQVDILFVVDDSASMIAEQQLLVAGFGSFLDAIDESGTDFHLGVIRIDFAYDDPERGRLLGLPPYLTRADDYGPAFRERALVGTEGSGYEKGLEAAYFAVSPQATAAGGPNEGFLRPAANLVVVVVSDEDDCSDEGRLGFRYDRIECYTRADELVPVPVWVDRFRALKPRPEQIQIAAIIGPQDAPGLCGEESIAGERYAEAAALTGGLVASICEPDWSSFLGDLGVQAVGLARVFPLTCGAKDGSVEVEVDGEPATGWSYDPDGRAIVFEEGAVPPRDSALSVEYAIVPGTCGD